MDKKRILIIDDEVGSARLLKSNLEQIGRFDVRVENWPEDAVAVAREFKPHLVLLDILMPRMPGGEVVAAFQADSEVKDTAIVFLTAAVRRHQVEDHEGIICDLPCIAKPASVEEIVRCIDTNIPRQRRPASPGGPSLPTVVEGNTSRFTRPTQSDASEVR